MKAKDIMTKDLTSVTETATLKKVEELLSRSRLSGIPVVDDEGKIIGYISEKDIIESAFPALGMGTDMLFVRNWAKNFLRLSQVGESLVRDYMTREPVCVTEEASDFEIVEKMITNHRKVLPVIRDGKLVGIITRSNLTRALMEKKEEQ
ncbi:CBS domain-containing protein [Candidatus Oleimmundimicrobium sp.]|uniref:CBS domain-containing protein n=1 Tax=Candidatus Oleimmundimicrobium sp. TaxID=3060597 RepID=UPI00271843C3|nr:CBS domain-containing protein [Candidatus Oleimmundimicrobium sp.]MDO8885483.1 CBS domain-containing protein [Candidatus Oleimmundimicrobium sp.]